MESKEPSTLSHKQDITIDSQSKFAKTIIRAEHSVAYVFVFDSEENEKRLSVFSNSFVSRVCHVKIGDQCTSVA